MSVKLNVTNLPFLKESHESDIKSSFLKIILVLSDLRGHPQFFSVFGEVIFNFLILTDYHTTNFDHD